MPRLRRAMVADESRRSFMSSCPARAHDERGDGTTGHQRNGQNCRGQGFIGVGLQKQYNRRPFVNSI
jgi:hypothetical protein